MLWINDGVAFFKFQVKTSLKSDPERIDDETPKPTNSGLLFNYYLSSKSRIFAPNRGTPPRINTSSN
jgi:hypothetical protein